MPIPTYTPGYPPDGSSLGQTKVTIRNNLDGTFQTLAVDHIDNNGSPGSQPAGYHKVIHIVTNSGNPTTVSGIGQLYSKSINSFTTDTALFWKTGGGKTIQLTTNIIPVTATNGYSFLPGGLIYQWGRITITNLNSVSVVFASSGNVAFPNNIFNVQVTYTVDDNTTVRSGVLKSSESTTGFTWTGTSSSHTQYVYWTAVGN